MKLNKIEKLKLSLKPAKFYQKIEKLDPTNLTEADRFYLKNFGIYNTKLRPDKFMLRLRIPGGRITKAQLDAIFESAKEFKPKILLTARSQIELHDLDFFQLLAIHKELEKRGVTSFQTLTDNFRNIITHPLDGVGEDSIIEVYPLILKMQDLFLKKEEFIGMIPRKFNTAISGNLSSPQPFFGNDCYFALALKDGVYGFNLYLGGKNSELAQDADIFVPPHEVADIFGAIIQAFKKYGLRSSRTKTRLYHLLQEIGIEGFKSKMEEFYKNNFLTRGKALVRKYKNTEDFFQLKDNTFAFRWKTKFGEISWEEFEKVLTLAQKYEVRIGIDQNVYFLHLLQKERLLSHRSQNSTVLVCAGERYCIYSLFDTKSKAADLPLDLLEKYNIRVGYSGCLKGCGRHILADIGLVGIRTNLFGEIERGVRLYLGGEYTTGKKAARLIFWAVPLRNLGIMLRIIIEDFLQSGYDDFEQFSKERLNKFSEAAIAYYYLQKFLHKDVTLCEFNNYETIKLLEQEAFKLP
ncbi:hypothetical protein [Nitratiruptor tergarcus]|uniref:Ferredoxin-nitrite reductase n=1 Tax=Nitratiruptor tergarcus DSM 16512 TaxID=1069081 RepID=A0A1W1WTV3_9BACT|nr:hypothetical protein [Nitratiruptor tergarcus]SMC09666.1 ferredoxin-nitrite reductase [Nitratiruptor tergarcus DSM 16512]